MAIENKVDEQIRKLALENDWMADFRIRLLLRGWRLVEQRGFNHRYTKKGWSCWVMLYEGRITFQRTS